MYPATFPLRSHSLALAALLLASAPQAFAVDHVSLGFGDLRIDFLPLAEGEVRFGIELTLAADGSVEAVLPGLHKATDVTLKRGVIGAARPEVAYLDFSIEQRLPAPRTLGRFGLESDDAALGISVEDASARSAVADADALILRLDRGAGAGADRLVLRFEASEGEVLTGTPAAAFGPSGTGKTLAAQVMAPPAGSEVTLTLRVVNQQGKGTLIPIKIKHNV